MINAAIVVATAILSSAIIVAAIRRWAPARLLDEPNARSSHTRPTPRGGGAAIVLTVAGGAVIMQASAAAASPRVFAAFLASALLVAAVSFLDDLRNLPWRVRLATHSAAAVMLIAGSFPIDRIALGPWGTLRLPAIIAAVLSFLWIAGLTNAYNFMDGIDGIAAGQAIVAAAGWFAIARTNPLIEWTSLLILGASIGFLIHNAPPARIFMGDVGAAFIGLTFAAFPLVATSERDKLALAAPLLVLPFLVDTIFTFFRRALRGEHLFSAHRSHLYQRLVISGMAHGKVSMIYSGIAALGAGAAVATERESWQLAGTLALAALGGMIAVYFTVKRRESMAEIASFHPLI